MSIEMERLEMTIVGFLIFVYFVYNQYSFERPKRYVYLLIPIYSLFMVFFTFNDAGNNIIFAIGLLIIGSMIGVFQGHNAEIQKYIGESGEARVKIRGGTKYLLGWLCIVIVQILVEIILAHHNVGINGISKEITSSVTEEIMPFSRVHKGGFWALWMLTGSASLVYTLTLSYRSSGFRDTIRRGSRRKDRQAIKNKKRTD